MGKATTSAAAESPKRTAKKAARTVSPSSNTSKRSSRGTRHRFTKLLTGDIAFVDGTHLTLYSEESEGYEKWTKVTRQAALHFDREWSDDKTLTYVLKKLKGRRFLRGQRDDHATGEIKWEIMDSDSVSKSVQIRFHLCCESLAREQDGDKVKADESKPTTATAPSHEEAGNTTQKTNNVTMGADPSLSGLQSNNNDHSGGEETLENVLWNADVGGKSSEENPSVWNRVLGFWGWTASK